jgi:TonB family protein
MRSAAAAALALTLFAALAAARGSSGGQASDGLAEADRLSAEVVRLFGQGKHDEAAPLAERVLEIRSKALGDSHLGVAEAEYNLGMIRVLQGRLEEAEVLLRKALAIYEAQATPPGLQRVRVVSGLALVRARLGHGDEALKLALAALADAEKALAPLNPELAGYHRLLADIYRLKRDYGKAEDSYLRAIEIWAKSAGPADARAEMAVEALMCTMAGGGYGKHKKVWARLDEILKDADPLRGAVLDGKAVSKPAPEYPAAAKAARVMGSVVIRVWVDEAGAVTRATAVCGNSLLAEASLASARRARFTPTLLDGKPVKVSGFITYNFVLQ